MGGCMPKPLDYFFDAIRREDVETVQTMLRDGQVSADDAREDGWRPMHQATQMQSEKMIEIIKILCSHGGCIEAQNNMGETPLHTAITAKNLAVIEALINEGADWDCHNACGKTPSHYAMAMLKKEDYDVYQSWVMSADRLRVRHKPSVEALSFASASSSNTSDFAVSPTSSQETHAIATPLEFTSPMCSPIQRSIGSSLLPAFVALTFHNTNNENASNSESQLFIHKRRKTM